MNRQASKTAVRSKDLLDPLRLIGRVVVTVKQKKSRFQERPCVPQSTCGLPLLGAMAILEPDADVGAIAEVFMDHLAAVTSEKHGLSIAVIAKLPKKMHQERTTSNGRQRLG